MTIPSLWRTELYHPLIVHLPIGILLLGSACGLFTEVRRYRTTAAGDDRVLRLMLIPGAALAWCAIYSGTLAEDVVNRTICDPTVTHSHRDLAFIAAYIFTAAAIIATIRAPLLSRITDGSKAAARSVSAALILLLAAGSFYLVSAAHLGASLVYLQAAGVYHPSESCKEFE